MAVHFLATVHNFKFQNFRNWVQPDGSFSEAGVPWPWSCSEATCHRVYNPAAISILNSTDYTTTQPTMSSSLYIVEETTQGKILITETRPNKAP